MKAQDQRRWSDRADGPRRFALLAAVALAHLAILVLLIAMPQEKVLRARDQALRLITIPLPPPAPPQPDPPKSAPSKAAPLPSKRSPTPAVKPPPPIPVPVPAVEAAANVDLSASVGSGALASGPGTGSGGSGGAGGGIARHAQWVGGGLTNRDYPDSAKRARLQGVVDVRFIVQTDGRVRDCHIDHSSGSTELDRMTCGIIEQRLLYNPALDPAGKPVEELAGRRFRFVMAPRAR